MVLQYVAICYNMLSLFLLLLCCFFLCPGRFAEEGAGSGPSSTWQHGWSTVAPLVESLHRVHERKQEDGEDNRNKDHNISQLNELDCRKEMLL